MICDDCGYCIKRVTEKGRNISCTILNDKQLMENAIQWNHCVTWTPKKVKKRKKR